MTDFSGSDRVELVRGFNRFYTRSVGALGESLLGSGLSLSEARMIFELANNKNATAKWLGTELGMDAGYVSRILRSFEKNGVVEKRTANHDARQQILTLTRKGRSQFAKLDAAARSEVKDLLKPLTDNEQTQLVNAMSTIQSILEKRQDEVSSFILRPHRPGDMGWIVHRQAATYAQEYGWNSDFEALVADIVAKFLREFDPDRERCWIAEKDGEIIGSIFLVKHSKTVAKLRLLYVERSARGLGVGSKLVNECINFARSVGYKKMTLWTNDILHSARHIYERVGFVLVHQEKHQSFGHDLTSQTWELDLSTPNSRVPV